MGHGWLGWERPQTPRRRKAVWGSSQATRPSRARSSKREAGGQGSQGPRDERADPKHAGPELPREGPALTPKPLRPIETKVEEQPLPPPLLGCHRHILPQAWRGLEALFRHAPGCRSFKPSALTPLLGSPRARGSVWYEHLSGTCKYHLLPDELNGAYYCADCPQLELRTAPLFLGNLFLQHLLESLPHCQDSCAMLP